MIWISKLFFRIGNFLERHTAEWNDSLSHSLPLQEEAQSTSSPKRRKLEKREKSTPKRSSSDPRVKSSLPNADPRSGGKLKTVGSRDPRLSNGATKPPDAELKLAADVVVRYLMPHYKEGRFATKVRVTYGETLLDLCDV